MEYLILSNWGCRFVYAGRYVDRITMTTTSTISPELTVRVFGIIRD